MGLKEEHLGEMMIWEHHAPRWWQGERADMWITAAGALACSVVAVISIVAFALAH